MINVINIVGKYLEKHRVGFYDLYGPNGNIVPCRMKNYENNQIVLKYSSKKKFLGGNGESGELEFLIYDRNQYDAMETAKSLVAVLDGVELKENGKKLLISCNRTFTDVDMSAKTDLLCISTTCAVDIN